MRSLIFQLLKYDVLHVVLDGFLQTSLLLQQNKNRFELLLDIMGSKGVGWTGDAFDGTEIDTTRGWLRSKANSIEGGTSEVQLNILAKRVLELPD